MSEQRPRQVFIVGMNGSGTTMLLDHLANHSLLFGYPTETRFLPYFLENAAKYGDLTVDANFRRLWDEMRESFVGRVGPQAERIPLPVDWRDQPRTVAAVFDGILRVFAFEHGKTIWCEKTPMHVMHLTLLARNFPSAKFIHIVRDGRDCAASFHRRWKFAPVRTIYRWKNAVRTGREQKERLGDRYMEVRYETVTAAPQQSLEQICEFLDIPYEDSILASTRVRPEFTGSDSISIARNQRRAVDYFDARCLAQLERVAGKCLAEFGYRTSAPEGDEDPSRWMLRKWELGDDLRRVRRVLFEHDRIFTPKRWPMVVKLIRGSLKQKATFRR
jgi:hypothetical protein